MDVNEILGALNRIAIEISSLNRTIQSFGSQCPNPPESQYLEVRMEAIRRDHDSF